MKLPSENWFPHPPTDPSAIQGLLRESGLDFPQEFLEFYLLSNGGEGELSMEPGWISLWPVEEMMQLNRDYEVHKWLPGFFGFGCNGGGEMFAFDTRIPQLWKVCIIPFAGMEEKDAVLVAESFDEFVQFIGKPMPD